MPSFSQPISSLVGANECAEPEGSDELPGKSNYFIGSNPEQWHTNIPQYGAVRYRNIYPGVDLVFYGKQGELEYDFVVAPRADPSLITLEIEAFDLQEWDPQRSISIEVIQKAVAEY